MVEEEVFQFMEVSNKPNHFPTKQELLDAGRSDLVFKILAQGGWLTAGWDHDSETLHVSSDNGGDDDLEDCKEVALPALASDSIIDVSAEDVSNKPEKIAFKESGIAGILNGLERERKLFYSEAAESKRGNRHQQFSEDNEYGNAVQVYVRMQESTVRIHMKVPCVGVIADSKGASFHLATSDEERGLNQSLSASIFARFVRRNCQQYEAEAWIYLREGKNYKYTAHGEVRLKEGTNIHRMHLRKALKWRKFGNIQRTS